MDKGLIKIALDQEKAKAILKMVDVTRAMIKTIDSAQFSSHVTREYYNVMRELMSVVLLLDGYKTHGEGAHKKLIEYLQANYEEFEEHEIALLEELRTIRNKIAYDGFFVESEYLERKIPLIEGIITKLSILIKKKQNSQLKKQT